MWLAGAQNLCPCNHKEADTRVICHCTLENKPTVVIPLGTDILILLVHLFASRLPDQDWFLRTKKNQFVDILRSMLTLVMQLQARCQQCSSLPAVIQWFTSIVSSRRLYLKGCWNKKSSLLSIYQIWESIPISRRRQKKSWKALSRYLSAVCVF